MIFFYSNLLILICSCILLVLNKVGIFFRQENFGRKIFNLLNLNTLNRLKETYQDLYLDENKLYQSLEKILISLLILILIRFSPINHLSVIIISYLTFEVIHLKLRAINKRRFLESKLLHFIYCLEILCLKNNINLIQAIKEIQKNSELKSANYLKEILMKYENSNSRNIENHFPRQLSYSRELKSLLSRISTFNDYSTLANNFIDFKKKLELDTEIKRNELIENIQLYLSLPIIIMMISASYPLYSSILFSLKGIHNS